MLFHHEFIYPYHLNVQSLLSQSFSNQLLTIKLTVNIITGYFQQQSRFPFSWLFTAEL